MKRLLTLTLALLLTVGAFAQNAGSIEEEILKGMLKAYIEISVTPEEISKLEAIDANAVLSQEAKDEQAYKVVEKYCNQFFEMLAEADAAAQQFIQQMQAILQHEPTPQEAAQAQQFMQEVMKEFKTLMQADTSARPAKEPQPRLF